MKHTKEDVIGRMAEATSGNDYLEVVANLIAVMPKLTLLIEVVRSYRSESGGRSTDNLTIHH